MNKKMTEKKRVVLNVIATYGRSLFVIACGLFSGRWCLMSLGDVDYGLYGVVGGLTGFIAFFNGLLADAVGRFYAFSVGQSKIAGGEGVEICRKWFNTALCVHTIVPVILIAAGYPIGEWCISNWLNMPPDRVNACLWVFRCVCIRCFIAMINVPYRAMYTAKQYIAELTIYSVVETAVNVVFLYYMVTHPGVWLTRYAIWSCLLFVVPEIIICIRARMVFEECRLRWCYLFNSKRLKDLFVFAAYRFGGALCGIVGQQGMALLVNKMLGARANAAMSVASTVSGHSQTFAGSLSSAMYPVITNACGEGNYEKMRKWSYAACKFSTIFVLAFALPLLLEIDEVMRLWLVNPPAGAASLCICLLLSLILEDITSGHYMAIFSVGDIRGYQISCSIAGLMVIPFAYVCIKLGLGVVGIGIGYVITGMLYLLLRLFYGKKIGTLSACYWAKSVLIPLTVSSVIPFVAGMSCVKFINPSFGRICLTTFCIELLFLPLIWLVVLDSDERALIADKVLKKISHWK